MIEYDVGANDERMEDVDIVPESIFSKMLTILEKIMMFEVECEKHPNRYKLFYLAMVYIGILTNTQLIYIPFACMFMAQIISCAFSNMNQVKRIEELETRITTLEGDKS